METNIPYSVLDNILNKDLSSSELLNALNDTERRYSIDSKLVWELCTKCNKPYPSYVVN